MDTYAKHFTGLFEDEVADVLRSLPKRIITDTATYYPKHGYDFTPGEYFTVYRGTEKSGIVNKAFLMDVLIHSEFTVEGGA